MDLLLRDWAAIQGKTANRCLIASGAAMTMSMYLSIWHMIIWSSWGGLIIGRPVANEQQGLGSSQSDWNVSLKEGLSVAPAQRASVMREHWTSNGTTHMAKERLRKKFSKLNLHKMTPLRCCCTKVCAAKIMPAVDLWTWSFGFARGKCVLALSATLHNTEKVPEGKSHCWRY